MDTQTGHARTVHRVLLRLRYYYQCFFLHLMLGMTAAAVLMCAVIRLGDAMPLAVNALNRSVFDSRTAAPARRTAPRVLEAVLYCTPGTADAYFSNETEALRIPIPIPENTPPPASLYEAATETEQKTADTPLPLPAVRDSASLAELYCYDADAIPAGCSGIRPVDLSSSGRFHEDNGGILFSNQTSYAPDPLSLLASDYPIAPAAVPTAAAPDDISTTDGQAPLVLILHTHGTESYAPDGASAVPENYSYRTQDTAQNVVSVGAVLAKTLEDNGIPVLHCTTMFDAVSYADAYTRAAAYIRETTAAYPSIAYVFDVHRDALESADGTILRPVTEIDGELCAQIMSVVGTDEAGAYHPGWVGNLTVAVHLQARLNASYPSFARPINLRTATFNAQYAPGSLLLEIGAAGNSVEEAKSAAYHLGCVLAALICGTAP